MAYNPLERPLGGGQVWIAKWDGDEPPVYPTDFEDIGDVQDASWTPKVATVKAYTSNYGVKEQDKEDVVSVEYEVKLKLGQQNQTILAMFCLGTTVGSNEIQPLTNLDQEYAVKFIPKYKSGQLWEYLFYRVKISPGGAAVLVNPATYGTLDFTMTGLADRINHEDNPFFELIQQTE